MFFLAPFVAALCSAGTAAAGAAAAAAGAAGAAAGAVGAAASAAAGAAGAAAAGAAGAVAGAAGTAAGAVAGAAGSAAGAVAGAAGSAAGAVAGAAGSAAGAVAGAAGSAASTVAGAAGSAASTVAGAAGSAASTVAGAAGSAANTVAGAAGKAFGTAVSTAAKTTTAVAAKSAAAVGQIPVVGDSIVGVVRQVGNFAGKNVTKLAKQIGLSGRNAKALGTIANGTTTHEINQQILRPYNEIKDEITGLGDIKRNVKILDDIAHGRLSKNDLLDIANNHKEEIANAALKEMDLPELQEIKAHVDILKDLKEGKLNTDRVMEVAASDLDLPNKKDLQDIKKILEGKATKKEIVQLIEDTIIPEEDRNYEEIREKVRLEFSSLTKEKLLQYVKDHKEEIAESVIKELDISEIKRIENGVDLLIRIKEGKASPEMISEEVITSLEILDKKELDNFKVLLTGKATKENLQKALLEYLDVPEKAKLDEYVSVLKKITKGNVNKEDLQEFLLSHAEESGFEDIFNNKKLMEDIAFGKVNKEVMEALIAEALGVDFTNYQVEELADDSEAGRFYQMGLGYLKGEHGMPRNDEIARYCLNKAVELGCVEAKQYLQCSDSSECLVDTVIPDDSEAGRFYQMGLDYLKGKHGTPCNQDMARYCLNKAIELGCVEAKQFLQCSDNSKCLVDTVIPDDSEAGRFYQMGLDYLKGKHGMPCNEEMARYCFRQAEKMGKK